MKDLNFAILVDGENASYNDYNLVLEEVEKHSAVAIKWVYADWTDSRHGGWKDILHDTASSPKQQFHYGKNAVDHALVMDAIELVNINSRINAVCIVSSDGGFYSLAQRIREKGLHVMGVGQKKTPEQFRKACHNFVYTNLLASEPASKGFNNVDSLLIAAYKKCAQINEPVYLGDFGTMLKKLDSSFDPRSHNSPRLKDLIKDKDNIFTIVDEQVDRCFIELKKKKSTENMNIYTGKIRMLEAKNQYGFITTKHGDFHFSHEELLIDKNILKKGLSVSFKAKGSKGTPADPDKNCPTAYSIVAA